MTKLMRFSRTGAWLTAFTITVLSVLPGKMRPHVLGNDFLEHFVAYFVTSSLFAIGYLRPLRQLSSAVLLAACAGLLECIQLWIPGRTASVGGFTTAAAGAWTGLLVVIVVRRAYERRFVVSYK